MNDSSAMSQHKTHREKDIRPTAKKSSNGVVTRQSSGESKSTDMKYKKMLDDGKIKPSTTTHQETNPAVDVLAASRYN